MTKTLPLLAAVAALALSGCDKSADGNAAASNSASAAAPVAAPNGSDWTQTVSKTPEGGFVMGNPNAPVKLIEYLSLTCSHCAEFARTGYAPLRDNYIAKGTVSYEVRNYVRDPIDVASALLARCNGPEPFFPLTEQMFANQEAVIEKAQGVPQREFQQLSTLPPTEQFKRLAGLVGLDEFVQQRGISGSKAKQCLSDKAALDELVKMQQTANEQYQIPGTPTFIINGEVAQGVGTWEQLEAALKAAGA
jgi:protein-disulfide isomerase